MHSLSKYMRLSEPTTKIRMKIDPYYQRRTCSPMTVAPGNLGFMRIYSRGFFGDEALNDSWVIGRYVFGPLGNEANIII